MAKSPHLTRNEFVKVMVGILGSIMGVIVGLPAIGYLVAPFLKRVSSDAWVPLGPFANFPIGTPTLASFTRTKVNGWERTSTSYGIYVFRQDESKTLTMSNICTHLACRVKWEAESNIYHCPCHDAKFGPEGQIISGPQNRPMTQYANKVENGILMVEFKG